MAFRIIKTPEERTRLLMLRLSWTLLVCSAPCAWGCIIRGCEDGHSGKMALPDPAVTPGAVDPQAVADLSGAKHLVGGIERNVCAADFRTGPIRAGIRNFAGLKKKACAEYGVARCDGSVEGDHLVSIEIGGCPDCLANIWPQPMDEARVKDHRVEDVLPKLVCAGKMTIQDAQKCIAKDWVACSARIGSLPGGL